MKHRFGSLGQYFYLITLSIVTLVIVVGFVYFYSNSYLNYDNLSGALETSDIIQKLDTVGRDDISSAMDKGNVRLVADFVHEVDNGLNTLYKIGVVKNDRVVEYLAEFKISMNEVLSLPALKEILTVIKLKVKNFRIYSESNGWQTLSRVSRLLESSASEVNENSTFKQLDHFVQIGNKYLTQMEDVVSTSTLPVENKDAIIPRLNEIKTNIDLLVSFTKNSTDVGRNWSRFSKALTFWMRDISSEVSYRNIIFLENSNKLVYFLVFVTIAIFVIVVIGQLFYFLGNFKDVKYLENFCFSMIRDGLVNKENKFTLGSSDFNQKLLEYREYVQARMGFANIFQESMPFASFMLDHNLNIIWANKLFYEFLNIQANVNWDYLQKFTNLGEQDPILNAMNENISGIYQIQIKLEHQDDPYPYEMYVSPVDYQEHKRIVVILYPLKSIENMLQNQTRSIVGPVIRSFDALINNQFSKSFQEKIKTDFEVAKIEDIYDSFIKYHNQVFSARSDLSREMDKLESKLYDNLQLVFDLSKSLTLIEEELSKEMIQFNEIKTVLLGNLDIKNKVVEIFSNFQSLANEYFNRTKKYVESCNQAWKLVLEVRDIGSKLIATREELKENRRQFNDFKNKLVKNISNIGGDNIKKELKDLEKYHQDFNRILTSMDILFSKFELMVENNAIMPTEDFDILKDAISSKGEQIFQAYESMEDKDEELVDNLSVIYGYIKTAKLESVNATKLISNNLNSFENKDTPTV